MEELYVEFTIDRENLKVVMTPQSKLDIPMNRYYARLEKHKEHISNYREYLGKICDHLAHSKNIDLRTVTEIRRIISAEIDMASSCDAPNKPGYERANND